MDEKKQEDKQVRDRRQDSGSQKPWNGIIKTQFEREVMTVLENNPAHDPQKIKNSMINLIDKTIEHYETKKKVQSMEIQA